MNSALPNRVCLVGDESGTKNHVSSSLDGRSLSEMTPIETWNGIG
jgi:hypothetical protein